VTDFLKTGGFPDLKLPGFDGLLFYSSFNDAFSSSEYIVSDDRIVVNRKEAGRKFSLPNLRYHPGLSLESHKNCQSGQLVTRPKFKLGTSQIQVGIVTY
jgi:hypothetical protein